MYTYEKSGFVNTTVTKVSVLECLTMSYRNPKHGGFNKIKVARCDGACL